MRFMPGRFVKHNKSTECPSSLIFFDTETTSQPIPGHKKRRLLTLKVGVAQYVRLEKGQPTRADEIVFTEPGPFWQWLKTKLTTERSTWVFAHNIAFDLTVTRFWDSIDNDEWWLYDKAEAEKAKAAGKDERYWRGCFIPEDPPTIVKVRQAHTKRVCWFVDSLNYYRCPLADLATKHGLSKNYTLLDWAPLDECVTYCRNDVKILKRSILALMEFVRANDLGVWKATAAGQAYAAYRHRFMGHAILPHNDEDARKHERRSYYGGEVGVYFVGRIVPALSQEPVVPPQHVHGKLALLQGPVYHLDVNSLYPSVMRDGYFPTQLVNIRPTATVDDVIRLPRGVGASARVSLNAQSRPYPLKHRGQLWFGMGRMETYLCGPELLAACSAGDVESLHEVHIYTTAPIFSRYVAELHRLRLDRRIAGDSPGEGIVKTLLNALPGKFGQRGVSMTPLPNYPCHSRWGTEYERKVARERNGDYANSRTLGDGREEVSVTRLGREIRVIGGNAFAVGRDAEPDSSFPAISAWVTAYGRERMRALRSICGPRTVLYQATDSLHVLEPGFRRLMRAGELHPFALGKLKVVGIHDTAEYRGINSYCLDGAETEAGLKIGAVPLASGDFAEEQFSRLQHILGDTPPGGIIVSTVQKNRAVHDIRGHVGPDGFVEPINKVWENAQVE